MIRIDIGSIAIQTQLGGQWNLIEDIFIGDKSDCSMKRAEVVNE